MSLLAQRTVWGAAFSLAACLAAAQALAGGAPPPLSPDDARCRSQHGEGFVGVTGTDACIRISGYIEAGADFSSWRGRREASPLTGAPALMTGAAAALDTRFDTPMGPGRIYIETGRRRLTP